VANSHFRNTGDDALASWSIGTDPPNHGNVFRFNSVQLPWRANCFGIYGGGTTIQDSVCTDTQYPGILLGRMFNANAFTATKVTGVSLLRAGGPQYGEQGALKLNPEQGPVQNIQISNVDIDSATYSALQFAAGNTIDTVSVAGVNITKAGGCGLLAQGRTGLHGFQEPGHIESGGPRCLGIRREESQEGRGQPIAGRQGRKVSAATRRDLLTLSAFRVVPDPERVRKGQKCPTHRTSGGRQQTRDEREIRRASRGRTWRSCSGFTQRG